MKEEQLTSILIATLRGIRPILFDRYGGDNKIKLEDLDKLYVNKVGECGIPILNIFSLLAAQNTQSVAKRFYGKQGRDMALGIMAFVNIQAVGGSDSMFAVLRDEAGKVYRPDDPRISMVGHVARLKDGIPNPKRRPMITPGWNIQLQFEHTENKFVTKDALKQMVVQGGILGLGTFRPIFGRYEVHWDKE